MHVYTYFRLKQKFSVLIGFRRRTKVAVIMTENKVYKLSIKSQWNGKAIDHEPVELSLSSGPHGNSVKVDVQAPFFNDPGCPPSPAKEPCDELWEYEVAEVFFLGENDRYLEVEFCPHGQHLVLLLDGTRNMFKDKLPLEYEVTIDKSNKTWSGSAVIPIEYFPPSVNKINAFAIHGSGDHRQYEALYPATQDSSSPDFHRLQFFQPFDFKALFPVAWTQPNSQIWTARINK